MNQPDLTNLVRRDFESLWNNETLDTEAGVAELILAQSIEGHAHTGAGAFHKRRYPELTTHQVVRLLGWPVKECRLARQALINEVFEWVSSQRNGAGRTRLVDSAGHPLLRVPWLGGIEVDPAEVLRGIYIGGLRDDEAVRARAEKLFDVNIGGGRCYVVDTRVMRELNQNADSLAHEAHDADELEEFRKLGMIVDPAEVDTDDIDEGPFEYYYIRYRVGPGHSDDAAIVGAGLLYSVDAALGAWLSDAVDTLEKFSGDFVDQDNDLSLLAAEVDPAARVPEQEMLLYVTLCAVALGKEEVVPDSSTRHLLAVDPKTDRSLLRCHLDFIEGVKGPDQSMAHGKTTTHSFYAYLLQRMAELRRRPSVAPRAKLNGLVSTGFAVVSPDAEPEELAARFADPAVELLIVCGRDGKPRGFIHPADLLHRLQN